MAVELELILSAPLKVVAGSYTLNLAADTAVKVVDNQWILKAHGLCRVIGMDGLIGFLGCFGLFLAFLICTFGITAGFLCATSINELLQPRTFSGTIFIGFSVFAGCTASGTFVFSLFVMLVTLEVRGLLLIGFLLAAVLLLDFNHQPYSSRNSSARMLILFSVAFMTMLLEVKCSHSMSNPSIIILVFSLPLLGYASDKIAFRKPRGYIILCFILSVLVSGLVLGFSIDQYSDENPVLSETANTLYSVAYKMVLLTGLVGAFAGALVAYFWLDHEAHGLSLGICGPVAVILFNLDMDSLSLHTFLSDVLGPGGELGLITGCAVASGLSVGLSLKHAHIMLPEGIVATMLVVLGVVFLCFITSVNLLIMVAIVLCLGLLSTMDPEDKLVSLQAAARDFAILAKVMMGATILGLAGLLTLAFGGHAVWGLRLALGVVTWKAFKISGESQTNG